MTGLSKRVNGVEWHRFIDADPEESERRETGSTAPTNGRNDEAPFESTDLPELRPPVDPLREARAAWKQAGEGEWSEAWQRIRELEQRQPGEEDLLHRLDWLRTLRPELVGGAAAPSAGQTPQVPPTALLRAKFLNRISASFRIACSDEADAWWTATLPPWEQVAFLRARWGVAARHGEAGFDRIEADLEPAAAMFRHDREMWFQALIRAVELSYLGDGEAANSLRLRAEELLRRERDLELKFSRSLESLDLVGELARHIDDHRSSRVEGLMRLALRGLVGEERDCRDDLVAEIVRWEQSPFDGLEILDRVAVRHPAFGSLLRDQVESYAGERGLGSDSPDGDQILRVVAEESDLVAALDRFHRNQSPFHDDRGEVRRRLLTLSLREGVRVSHVIEALRSMPGETAEAMDPLYGALHLDAPLAMVTSGCLALWHV